MQYLQIINSYKQTTIEIVIMKHIVLNSYENDAFNYNECLKEVVVLNYPRGKKLSHLDIISLIRREV